MRAIDANVVLDEIAAGTFGIVTRSALLDANWSESRIQRANASGALVRVAAGVYRVRGAPWTRQASRHAAVAVAGTGAVLARWSAAEAHGFAEARPGPHHLFVPHDRRSTIEAPELAVVTRTRRLDQADMTEVAGVTTTTAARTLLHLAYPEHRLAIEIDGFRWHSSPARKRADEERQNRLILAGWTVLRFSASVVRASPAALVGAVAAVVGNV